MKNKEINNWVIKKDTRKFYNIENSKCPICDDEINVLTGAVKYKNIGYHMNCFLDIKIKK